MESPLEHSSQGGSSEQQRNATILATQLFAIRNVLIDYCDQSLSSEAIDAIMARIRSEMTSGVGSWAFRQGE